MSLDLQRALQVATSTSPWDLGNEVLYDLCRKYPFHREAPAVIAKIWLIGRSYAAAIERRRIKEGQEGDFYVEVVAPRILNSQIDTWIAISAEHATPNEDSFGAILSAHANVTKLFGEISGLEKRSLASKYLHFHLPQLFYIYDTRAVMAMRLLSSIGGRASRHVTGTDSEYCKFAEKCLRLQTHIDAKHGMQLTPRQIDTLLLRIHSDETPQ